MSQSFFIKSVYSNYNHFKKPLQTCSAEFFHGPADQIMNSKKPSRPSYLHKTRILLQKSYVAIADASRQVSQRAREPRSGAQGKTRLWNFNFWTQKFKKYIPYSVFWLPGRRGKSQTQDGNTWFSGHDGFSYNMDVIIEDSSLNFLLSWTYV